MNATQTLEIRVTRQLQISDPVLPPPKTTDEMRVQLLVDVARLFLGLVELIPPAPEPCYMGGIYDFSRFTPPAGNSSASIGR